MQLRGRTKEAWSLWGRQSRREDHERSESQKHELKLGVSELRGWGPGKGKARPSFNFYLFIYLFNYLWLCWVFVSA